MQGKTLPEQSVREPVYVGIDVCKDWLEVHIHPGGQSLRLANSRSGVSGLKRRLGGRGVALVVMEATAKYHRRAQRDLSEAGFAVAVVNPQRARLFAQATGVLAKTDPVDAERLAILAATLNPEARPPATEEVEALQELVRARSAAVRELTGLKNRRGSAQTRFLKAELRRQIANQERAIARFGHEIARRIAADAALTRRYQILLSIPGLGPGTAAVLLADCAELGRLSSKAAALLTGLAPIAADSGGSNKPRHIKGGRKAPRNALYMAALAAIRVNPDCKAFYQRLREAGKKPKVALTAVMRKLIVLANTLIKDDRKWAPHAP